VPGFLAEVLRYLARRFLPMREREFIKSIFEILDYEKDGELEFEELIEGFKT
jgi:Ca2+-binding EF-hand superfamily protein